MKQISEKERPFGKGYTSFSNDDIINETEKAFLIKQYSDFSGEFYGIWVPKSKILFYVYIDNRDIVDNGKSFVKNENYGKSRYQFFIPNFFVKDKSSLPTMAELAQSYKEKYTFNHSELMGVSGIDY